MIYSMKFSLKDLKLYHLLVLFVLLLSIGVRGYRVADKDTLFLDENLSIVLSNYAARGWSWPPVAVGDTVRVFEGKELKEFIFGDDNGIQNIASDLWMLRKGTRDVPHTNLYYSFLRISFFQADTANLESVVWRSFLLNIFFLLVGFFFLYKLLSLLFPDRWILVVCGLGVAFLNPVAISNSLLMREYHLQQTLFIILVYVLTVLVLRLVKKEKLFQKKLDYLYLILITSLSLLSGYLGVPFVFMLWGGLGVAVLALSDRKWRNIAQIVGAFLASVVLVLCIYIPYFDAFFVDRGTEAFGKMTMDAFWGQISGASSSFQRFLGLEVMAVLIASLVVSFVFLARRRKLLDEQNFITAYILLCSAIWFIFALYIAPEKEIRYGCSVIPFLFIAFPFVLSMLKSKVVNLATPLLIVFFIFKSFTTQEVYWGIDDVGDHYKNDTKTPFIVGDVFSPWMQTGLAPYYTNGRTIIFTFGQGEFEERLNDYDEAYVLLGREPLSNIILPQNYAIASDSVFSTPLIQQGKRMKVRKVYEK